MPTLNAPTRIIFVVTLFLAVIALVTFFVMAFPQNNQVAFWTALAAYVGLALGCVMKGV
jgi:4-amino-4-deoxy-L-arabinose transferase-like glycosyltransferase